jgi:hypothetical protein
MTYLVGGRIFSGLGCVLLLAAVLAASGCSTSVDEAMPVSGAIDTGTYPNLNIPPKAATRQFTPEESAAKLASLRAKQQRIAPSSGETPEQRRKRLQLLKKEQDDTLKVIENN